LNTAPSRRALFRQPDLPPNTVGRDYRDRFYAGPTNSGTGVELNLHGLAAIKIGWVASLEFDLPGLGGRARSAPSGHQASRLRAHWFGIAGRQRACPPDFTRNSRRIVTMLSLRG
jgi:hypothetical protein